jgi:HlyD family secretion protein
VTRGRIIAGVVVLVVVLAIVGGIMLSASARVPQVTVADVQKQDITQVVTASGQLEGDVKADVYPGSQGTIKSIEVNDGQKVRAGQVLATLDSVPLDVGVAQAQAAYYQAESALVLARRSAPTCTQERAADKAIAAAREGVDAARAQLVAAKSAPIVFPGTADSHAAAIEQAEAGVLSAQAQLYSAKASHNALRNQDAAITAARAGVDAADEALHSAQDTRDKAVIRAPIDGVVVFAGGSASAAGGAGAGGAAKPAVGSAVSQAAAPFTIYQLAALNFNAQVDEADISNVSVGMKGSVTLDAFPGVTFATKVVQVKTQAIQTSTGGTAFPVLLSLKNTGKRLLVGMGGNVDVDVSAITGAVVVPVEALFDETGGTYVYTVDASNVVHHVKVKTGVMTDTQAQILSGVNPGDKVALGGLSSLKDGQTVRVK